MAKGNCTGIICTWPREFVTRAMICTGIILHVTKGILPREFEPREFEPREFEPREFEPREYEPRELEPMERIVAFQEAVMGFS